VKSLKFVTVLIGLFLLPIILCAQSVSDYLILQNIGSYKFSTQSVNPITDEVKQIPGYTILKNPGVLTGTDHFRIDHKDTTFETDYESDVTDIGVEVQVTQHTGGDSDRWLLHEIENGYRSLKSEKLGMPIQATRIREINGNKFIGCRGDGYRWLSNNVVVDISYTDLKGNKPEPLEIVQAYLAKYPSTIAITDATFKSNAYNIKWIKDEMDRRLWLCDKWNAQYQGGGVTQANLMVKLLENMDIFLKYREKYFKIAAEDESNLLDTYHESNNLDAIQTKLTEYKKWWAKHKDKRISL
jgi:hypothetical protein